MNIRHRASIAVVALAMSSGTLPAAAAAPMTGVERAFSVFNFIVEAALLLLLLAGFVGLICLALYIPATWLVGLAIRWGWLPARAKPGSTATRARWIEFFDPAAPTSGAPTSIVVPTGPGGFSSGLSGFDVGGSVGDGGSSGGGGASGSW